jgi:glycosidase
MSESPWWRGAVIYQIYPRSSKDTNGDGVGEWRKELPSLHTGDIQFLDTHAAVLSFTRSHGSEKLFIAFNLSPPTHRQCAA